MTTPASSARLLGFDAGYAMNFATIIGLFSTATFLYWRWFARVGAIGSAPRIAAVEGASD